MGAGDRLDVGGAERAAVGRARPSGRPSRSGAGCEARAGAGAPVGSLSTVPASSTPFGLSPFMAAIAFTDTRAPAARPESVSPGRTV